MEGSSSKKLTKRELPLYRKRLATLFNHPRIRELKSSELEAEVAALSRRGVVGALKIVDGQAVGFFGSPEQLDFGSGGYRVESTTTTIIDDHESKTVTVLLIWQKEVEK